MTFKVGDRIRRATDPVPGAPVGFETVVVEPEFDAGLDRVWYRARDGEIVHGDINAFEIAPTSTYDWITVTRVDPEGELHVSIAPMATRDPDRLERAAAVLTALAGALRDGR